MAALALVEVSLLLLSLHRLFSDSIHDHLGKGRGEGSRGEERWGLIALERLLLLLLLLERVAGGDGRRDAVGDGVTVKHGAVVLGGSAYCRAKLLEKRSLLRLQLEDQVAVRRHLRPELFPCLHLGAGGGDLTFDLGGRADHVGRAELVKEAYGPLEGKVVMLCDRGSSVGCLGGILAFGLADRCPVELGDRAHRACHGAVLLGLVDSGYLDAEFVAAAQRREHGDA
mmetsp:Transcript_30133/g.60475  ORF Transcript_30133/g.60475 Transcript_30133/m.60475 type:complete len:227 (+) Transcript_30133:503-1183(+)